MCWKSLATTYQRSFVKRSSMIFLLLMQREKRNAWEFTNSKRCSASAAVRALSAVYCAPQAKGFGCKFNHGHSRRTKWSCRQYRKNVQHLFQVFSVNKRHNNVTSTIVRGHLTNNAFEYYLLAWHTLVFPPQNLQFSTLIWHQQWRFYRTHLAFLFFGTFAIFIIIIFLQNPLIRIAIIEDKDGCR